MIPSRQTTAIWLPRIHPAVITRVVDATVAHFYKGCEGSNLLLCFGSDSIQLCGTGPRSGPNHRPISPHRPLMTCGRRLTLSQLQQNVQLLPPSVPQLFDATGRRIQKEKTVS